MLSTFMMVSYQEASGIAAKDASSKPWMTKHSHLHVQEEVKVMQMMGDDTEVNVMEPKLWSIEITCKCRHLNIIMAGMAVFLRGWLPHRGKAQMACNYCFPTRTMF